MGYGRQKMIWFLLLGVYASGATFFLVLKIQKRQANEDNYINKAQNLMGNELAAKEQIRVLLEMAKIQHSKIPWYERSFSTVGVILFLSMLVAAGIQTVKASIETIKADNLQQEMKALESQRSNLEILISDIARSVINKYRYYGQLDRTEEQILHHRLRQLDTNAKQTHDNIVETYQIALILGDFNKAVSILDRNLELLNITVPADRVSLAEYYYLVGAIDSAKELIKKLRLEMSSLSEMWRFKIIILSATMDVDENRKGCDLELSSLLRISTDEANLRLSREINKLKKAAEQIKIKH